MESRDNNIDSTSIIRVADAGYVEAVITTQSIIDAHYVIVNITKTPKQEFLTALAEIMSSVKVASISEENIRSAMAGSISDFDDASQIACAEALGCDCIISSDKKMKRDSNITVYTPTEFCNMVFLPMR